MSKLLLAASLTLLGWLGTCWSTKLPGNTRSQALYALFPEVPEAPDTVHFFLPEHPAGTPVPDSLLRACLDSAQYASLHFDTGEAQFWAVGNYDFAPEMKACLLQTSEFWFGKQSLLLYDKKQKRFFQTLEVGNFYGGDGGQTAKEAWWFRQANPPRLYLKTADHGFSMHEASEPTEYLWEHGELLEWETSGFRPLPLPDSSAFLQKFRMNREW